MTSLKDIIRHNLGRNKDEYLSSFQCAIDSINNKTHEFDDVLTYQIKGKAVYKVESVASLFYARHINKLLKRLYKIKQADRDTITQQISALLMENSPFYVIKGDIANFYESINRDNLIKKLKDDRLLDLRHINVIEKLFCNSGINIQKGIPRGISFSSTLSELYLRCFDEIIRKMPGVYYYARYVDDFIIFTHDNVINVDCIENELSKLKLDLNKNKTHMFKSHLLSDGKQNITFLGYMHTVASDKKPVVKISNKRIRKIKTRIVLSFLAFFKDKNIELLELRLKFLTGNYVINTKQESEKKLLAGFYYNNCAITDFSQVGELDRFLMKIIKSKSGFIPKDITTVLNNKITEISKKHYFSKGFNSRTVHTIEVEKFKEIKACWDREHTYEKK